MKYVYFDEVGTVLNSHLLFLWKRDAAKNGHEIIISKHPLMPYFPDGIDIWRIDKDNNVEWLAWFAGLGEEMK